MSGETIDAARDDDGSRRRAPVGPPLVVLALGTVAFLALAGAGPDGELGTLDSRLLLALRRPGDPGDPLWLEETVLAVTALGGYPLIVLALAAVAGLLVVTRRYGAALYAVLSVGSGALVSHLLKIHYARPRPDLVAHLDVIHTASFPSGHATVSTLAYLTLAALAVRFAADRWVRVYALALAVFVAFIVGLSRVYLGVHWPSDVAAGWALGAAWASLAWLVWTFCAYRARRGGAG